VQAQNGDSIGSHRASRPAAAAMHSAVKPGDVLVAVAREELAFVFQSLGWRSAARRMRGVQSTKPHAAVRTAAHRSDDEAAPQLPAGLREAAKQLVVEMQGERRLRFSPADLQSRMRLDDPHELVAAYTRQMMSFLLFNPDPAAILMIGLGGGSMAKFCHSHLPRASLTVVEVDARVIALRDAFFVPPDDARLRVVHDDGARYMRLAHAPLDAILVDAFDESGVAQSLADPQFFLEAARRLAPDGVLIMNLHGDSARFAAHLRSARAAFGARSLLAPVTANENLLLFAWGERAVARQDVRMDVRARRLQSMLRLNFVSYLRRLREARTIG